MAGTIATSRLAAWSNVCARTPGVAAGVGVADAFLGQVLDLMVWDAMGWKQAKTVRSFFQCQEQKQLPPPGRHSEEIPMVSIDSMHTWSDRLRGALSLSLPQALALAIWRCTRALWVC